MGDWIVGVEPSRHQQVLFGLLIMAEFSVHAADIDMAEVEVGVVVEALFERFDRQRIASGARIGCGQQIEEFQRGRIALQTRGAGRDRGRKIAEPERGLS